jgi:hypothetical protein
MLVHIWFILHTQNTHTHTRALGHTYTDTQTHTNWTETTYHCSGVTCRQQRGHKSRHWHVTHALLQQVVRNHSQHANDGTQALVAHLHGCATHRDGLYTCQCAVCLICTLVRVQCVLFVHSSVCNVFDLCTRQCAMCLICALVSVQCV